jgi:hypothetical protein
MPEYGGKHFAYTPAGKAAYKKAKANGKKANGKPKSRRGKK